MSNLDLNGNEMLLSFISSEIFATPKPDDTIFTRLNGNSNAAVYLIQSENMSCIRKIAVGSDALVLKSQVEYLTQQNNSLLPKAVVTAVYQEKDFFAYDMEYIPGCCDMHKFIHSLQPVESDLLFERIFSDIHRCYQSSNLPDADFEIVKTYFTVKGSQNVEKIQRLIENIINIDSFKVNGELCSLTSWDFLLDAEKMAESIRILNTSQIHGDLTVENMIALPQSVNANGYFVIDPNSHNIFNSPLIDWGKVFQSLHHNYEALNADPQCSFSHSEITVPSLQSPRYARLHQLSIDFIKQHYGEQGLKEVYLHEIVNYLRLLPRQFTRSLTRGMAFFGVACKIINEYHERT